jgi:putative nucleotidyltransferase with HDIG domain
MNPSRKYFKGRSNVVYDIDGASYGMDDRLVEAIRASIRKRVENGTLVIPRLPKVAGRILQLSQDPNIQIQAVTDVVKGDPILATRVLGLANAAAFGGNGEIKNLGTAITRLGMRKLRDLVFAESMQTKVFPARAYIRLVEQSWRLSLGAAVACEAIAKATGHERDEAFLIGLLHDIGKPTLVNAILELERKNNGQSLGEELVELVLSQLHEEIGAYVLEQWKMPPAVVEAARAHHRYQGPGTASTHGLICLTNLVCEHLGIGSEQRDVSFNLESVTGDLGLDLARMERIVEEVSGGLEGLLAGFGGLAGSRV